jgi:hypothetical protein
MSNNPRPVVIDRYFCFESGGGFIFSIVGKTRGGDDIVIGRTYRYRTVDDMIHSARLTRGKNTEIPIVWNGKSF